MAAPAVAAIIARAWAERGAWAEAPLAIGPTLTDPAFDAAFVAAVGCTPRAILQAWRSLYRRYAA